jgi:hypothetical protein
MFHVRRSSRCATRLAAEALVGILLAADHVAIGAQPRVEASSIGR